MSTVIAPAPPEDHTRKAPIPAASAVEAPAATLPPPEFGPLRRLTIDEYHAIAEAGILDESQSVELLEGWLVPKRTHRPPHDMTVDIAGDLTRDRVPSGWRARIQSAISLTDSEPEPDIAVVRGPATRYATAHPQPDEIALLMEVAESSLLKDRRKATIYARAGIAQYWIVNLIDRQIECYTEPLAEQAEYRQRTIFQPGETLTLAIGDGEPITIPVDEILVELPDEASS